LQRDLLRRLGGHTVARSAWKLHGLAVASAAALFVVAAPSEAAHTFAAQGLATRDDVVYRLSLGAQLQRFLEPGTSGYGIILFLPAPTAENPFEIAILEEANFLGQTNFIDAGDEANVPVVQTDYWAESTTAGIDFRLDGVRIGQAVTARGHYQDYSITIEPVVV
jgi:hypothetical protein